MAIKKVSAMQAKGRRGTTDWKKVKSMTDDEIRRATISDSDARELRSDELLKFRRGNR